MNIANTQTSTSSSATTVRLGWFKCIRGPDAKELARRARNAFILAWFIAERARFSDGFNADGLQLGEAMLGDYRQYGMSEREYRTAKQQLEKWAFATFRTTNKGTLAKLIDTRLFDPLNIASDGQSDTQETDNRQASDRQETTNKYGKNGKTEKRAPRKSDSPGLGKRAAWQIAKDRREFRKQLDEEKQKVNPNPGVIATLTAELKRANQELTELTTETTPKPTTKQPKPEPLPTEPPVKQCPEAAARFKAMALEAIAREATKRP